MGFGLRTGACKVLSKRARRACGVAAISLAAAAATRFSGTAFGLRPALAKSRRSGHAGLLFPSLLRRRPVSLGPLSGFAWRLQSPVETGTPARRRSEGTLFLNRLDCCPALAMPDAPLQAIPDALMGSNSSFFISDALLQASGAFVQITWQAANL